MGVGRLQTAAQAVAAPPGGWPGGAWGAVMTITSSGYVVDDEDYLFEYAYEGALPSWGDAMTFQNQNGASARFGWSVGSGVSYSRVATIAGVPRYRGEMASGLFTPLAWRVGLPAPGNYTVAVAIGHWHSGTYSHNMEVRPDGGASVGGHTNVSMTIGRIDAAGIVQATSAAWEAAEPTSRIAFTANEFVEIWASITGNGTHVTFCSIRVYEA